MEGLSTIRLNGWQRIGIVLSVPILLLGFGGLIFGEPNERDDFAQMIFFVPGAWLSVYIAIWAVKWIARGFKNKDESINIPTVSHKKIQSLIACFGSVTGFLAAIAMGCLAAMIFYHWIREP